MAQSPPPAVLHERLAAATGADPAQYLRAAIVDEARSPQALAEELGWSDDDVRALLRAHRVHLRLAGYTRRIGQFLADKYPAIAFNALIQMLAVLAGFALASAWQARQEALKDTREQLSVLSIVASEVSAMSTQAGRSARSEQCRLVPGTFKTEQWKAIVERGRALVLGPLAKDIQTAYDEVENAVSASVRNRDDGPQCQQRALGLRKRLEQLDDAMTVEVRELDDLHTSLIASQTRDDELRSVRLQLDLLGPLEEELLTLSDRAIKLSTVPGGECKVDGLEMTAWARMVKEQQLLLLGPLRRQVEETYDAVAVAIEKGKAGLTDVACREVLTNLRESHLGPLKASVADRIKELTERRVALLRAGSRDLPTTIDQARSSGLLRFSGGILMWSVAALLVAPTIVYGSAYGLMLAAARTIR